MPATPNTSIRPRTVPTQVAASATARITTPPAPQRAVALPRIAGSDFAAAAPPGAGSPLLHPDLTASFVQSESLALFERVRAGSAYGYASASPLPFTGHSVNYAF